VNSLRFPSLAHTPKLWRCEITHNYGLDWKFFFRKEPFDLFNLGRRKFGKVTKGVVLYLASLPITLPNQGSNIGTVTMSSSNLLPIHSGYLLLSIVSARIIS
jgi:hypothetical protein